MFLAALIKESMTQVDVSGIGQIPKDLGQIEAEWGKFDVLGFGDRGGAASGQQVGKPDGAHLSATLGQTGPLDQIVNFINPGGTLVLTGCSVFGSPAALKARQDYATAKNITIIGSTTDVDWGSGTFMGIFINIYPRNSSLIDNSPGVRLSRLERSKFQVSVGGGDRAAHTPK